MASVHRLFDGARDGVAVTVERRDAKGIAGFRDRVNDDWNRYRRGDILAMSPFHGIPVLTPADFLERLTRRKQAAQPSPPARGIRNAATGGCSRPDTGEAVASAPRILNAVAEIAIIAIMKRIAAKEAKNRFGTLLDAAQGAPVCVTKNGREVGVMLSMPHYERLRGAAWERLTATMDALGAEASANGLTEARLEALLADES